MEELMIIPELFDVKINFLAWILDSKLFCGRFVKAFF